MAAGPSRVGARVARVSAQGHPGQPGDFGRYSLSPKPPRLQPAITEALAPGVRVLGTLGKDLTKTADEELESWLRPLTFESTGL